MARLELTARPLVFELARQGGSQNVFVGEATEAPTIPAELLNAELSDFQAGFWLEEGLAAAEGETSLALKAS